MQEIIVVTTDPASVSKFSPRQAKHCILIRDKSVCLCKTAASAIGHLKDGRALGALIRSDRRSGGIQVVFALRFGYIEKPSWLYWPTTSGAEADPLF